MLSMVRNVSVVNTVITPSDMVCVLILDVVVMSHVLETNNRYVEETGLSPYTRSVSRLTVYQARKLKPGVAWSRFYHLMQIGKIAHSFWF